MTQNIVDVSAFTDPLVAPIDSEAADAASLMTPLQGLANRTLNLANRIGGNGVGGSEWVYEDGPRTRVVLLQFDQAGQASGQIATGSNSWYGSTNGAAPNQGHFLSSVADFATLVVDFNKILPNGGTLKRVKALITPGAARTVQTTVPGDNGRAFHAIHRYSPNFSTPSAGSFQGPLHAGEQTASGIQLLDTGIITEVIAKETSILQWKFIGGSDAGTNRDIAHAMQITYEDPGPRSL